MHIAIWFKCNDLLLINSSKFWQIITGFQDSVRVFCIAEIIGLYTSRSGLTRYLVPPVLEKTWYSDIFIFLVPTWKVPGLLTTLVYTIQITLHKTIFWLKGIVHRKTKILSLITLISFQTRKTFNSSSKHKLSYLFLMNSESSQTLLWQHDTTTIKVQKHKQRILFFVSSTTRIHCLGPLIWM